MTTTNELTLAGAEPVAEVIADGNGLRVFRRLPAGTKLYDHAHEASSKGGEAAKLYVECRECSNCGHIGINDDAAGMAACNTCEWNGPSPKEDHCPGCGRDGTMSGSCRVCGHRTTLIADARLAAGACP